MRKLLLAVFVCSAFLLLAPSLSTKASEDVGIVFIDTGTYIGAYALYCDGAPSSAALGSYGKLLANVGSYNYQLYAYIPDLSGNFGECWIQECRSFYIPTLTNNQTLSYSGYTANFFNDIDEFYDDIPEEYRPVEPTVLSEIWEDFYELYYRTFGIYPQPGSLFDWLKRLSVDYDEFEIVYPTMTPSPTPIPTPTPIPVQTIFVPDGNGNTTIIYQYPDPTSGVITQSPYNPNIENNITVNCDCNGSGGSGDNTFGTDPQDPYTLTSSMLWADGFGVEISDNPLTAANESQQTLAEAAADYSDDVKVLSNSFNILPTKWITLVGLLGGILIIAGLIRTFLGG